MVIVFCDGIKRMLDVSTVHRSPLFWFHCMTRERVRWGDDDVIVSLALCSESKWNESSTLHYALGHFSSTNTSTLRFCSLLVQRHEICIVLFGMYASFDLSI